MELGAHLPLIEFDGAPCTLADLRAYAGRAAALGYSWLCANDQLVFSRPWLDGPTALAATIDAAAGMTIATTVALPVVRGAAPTAKTLAALHQLSGGRLVAGLGPWSARRSTSAGSSSPTQSVRCARSSVPEVRPSGWRAGGRRPGCAASPGSA